MWVSLCGRAMVGRVSIEQLGEGALRGLLCQEEVRQGDPRRW